MSFLNHPTICFQYEYAQKLYKITKNWHYPGSSSMQAQNFQTSMSKYHKHMIHIVKNLTINILNVLRIDKLNVKW